MIQEVLVILTQVATPLATKVRELVFDVFANVIVSVVIAIVTLLAEPLMIVTAVPTVNDTLEFAGKV
jgi:hypothetical protein